MGVSDRTPQGSGELSHGADLVVKVAQNIGDGNLPWTGQESHHRILLSGPHLSSQRLGGPCGRRTWL
ncbi:hypothetical protein SBDP1_1400005 [Syntrophobacter sp. SbD1]|nr:hypothetical protein SBDP1_1400005 [Syntrophobacter sp. SbD1]